MSDRLSELIKKAKKSLPKKDFGDQKRALIYKGEVYDIPHQKDYLSELQDRMDP